MFFYQTTEVLAPVRPVVMLRKGDMDIRLLTLDHLALEQVCARRDQAFLPAHLCHAEPARLHRLPAS
jgi:hypothetical protein